MGRKPKQVTTQHYLYSLDTLQGMIMHGYLIVRGDDQKALKSLQIHAVDRIMHETEQHFGPVRLPMILCTILDPSGIEIVETHVVAKFPEIKDSLAEFMREKMANHFSIFAEDTTSSDELMELH